MPPVITISGLRGDDDTPSTEGHRMKIVSSLALTAAAALLFAASSPRAEAQVAVGVNIGPAPVCPYGYYDYAPYPCAPYG